MSVPPASLDRPEPPARGTGPPEQPGQALARATRWRWQNVSLLWRVFAANAVVCVVATALLAWTPVTVHRVATPQELVVLAIGLVGLLSVDLILLRRVFGPLRRLVAVMSRVDPHQPGRRADPSDRAGREVVALAEALNSMLDRLEDERRESARRTLAAQEAERSRVARELHDEVGQTLTAVALQAERAAATDGPAQREALAEIAETVLRSLQDVHRIGRQLRPEALEDLGLVNALIALSSRVAEQTGVPVRRDFDGHLPPLPREIELVIYRVAQEGLTNAVRHSEGTEVAVSLKRADGRIVLTVADDGRGIGEPTRLGGLAGMRERAMLIDAQLEIRSGPRGGTEIVLGVPVPG